MSILADPKPESKGGKNCDSKDKKLKNKEQQKTLYYV